MKPGINLHFTAALHNYNEVLCAQLHTDTLNKILVLAGQTGIAPQYILSRVNEYDKLITHTRNNKIIAGQFIQQFTEADNMYVYHGPAFSVNGAFLPMFLHYIYTLGQKYLDKNIYLLAEIQNPKMLMMLHGLFNIYGFSCFNKTIPADIQNAIPLFKNRYQHIGILNAANFTTRTNCSIYKESNSCNSLNALLSQKNISLAEGDNLLYAVKLPASAREREKITDQLLKGVIEVNQWSAYKNSFLKNIESL